MRLVSGGVSLLCLLAGCAWPDVDAFARAHTTPEERSFPRRYLHLLAAGQTDSAAALLDASLRSDSATRTLQQVGAVLREARWDSLHLIGLDIHDMVGTGAHGLNLSYERRPRPGAGSRPTLRLA